MNNKINLSEFTWINKPINFKLAENKLTIKPECNTDLWQRTHYGFQNDNAPALLTAVENDFSFLVKTKYKAKNQYDQCGILLYQDSENWVKISVEYENELIARLGSVVTNLGFSDWATTDISTNITEMWFRISRRGQDFFAEYSVDGENFRQMRIFHMHKPIKVARVGVYACSPIESGFKANFSEFEMGPSVWELHK